MPHPTVSVVTPAYNHAAFIGECIESVLGQTFADWEMIMVDDGSSDETASIAEGFGDSRIRVVRQVNRGIDRLAETYNHALSIAQGDLVAILEGDDIWPAEKLSVQVGDFDDPSVALSAGRFQMIDLSSGQTTLLPPKAPPPAVRDNQPVGRAAFGLLDPDYLTFAFPVTVVMRRSALVAAGGFVQRPGLPFVDYTTLLAMVPQGEWRWHDDVLGIWRRHESSVTRARYARFLNDVYQAAVEYGRMHHSHLPISEDEWVALDRRWRNFQLERCSKLARSKSRQGRHREAASLFKQSAELAAKPQRRLLETTSWRLESLNLPSSFLWRTRNHVQTGDDVVYDEMTVADFPYLPLP